MDIRELIKKKKEMESDITSEVQEIIIRFQTETGFTPNAIYIEMIKDREMGVFPNISIVSRCKTELDIFD